MIIKSNKNYMDHTNLDKKNINAIVNEIIFKYYNKEDNQHKDRESSFHGDNHIKVVVMIAGAAQDLYNKYARIANLNTFLKPNEQYLTLIIATLHDSGRVHEGDDKDEFSSALLCLSYLLENNLCDVKTAIKLAVCVAGKDLKEGEDDRNVSLLTNFLRLNFRGEQDFNNALDQYYPTDEIEGLRIKLQEIDRKREVNKPKSENYEVIKEELSKEYSENKGKLDKAELRLLKVNKLKKLLNFDAIKQALQGYKKNKNEIDNFVQNDLYRAVPRLANNTGDNVDIVRCGPKFDEEYAIYAKIFQNNSEALEEFRKLQKEWEGKRIYINYNDDGTGHFNQRATLYIENKEYDLDFNKFCEEYYQKGSKVSKQNQQSSKTFKYFVIGSVSIIGASLSVIGFYSYHLLTKTAFISPVLGICAAIGLALGFLISKFVEIIYKYKDYANPEESLGKNILTTLKLTFGCGDSPQQTMAK